ncbi:unnamed protein product [Notodromas monacha]|uniref:Histone deacetylase 11 n=1 Tax=Notodromas monacha TaxID=399045 RepID=A0A7R9GGA8_9CRUS|nr:unnamed protein product [Notodromas monacha]CAG0919766.1 unnamed protein product [Notodromas monacha]
MAGSSTGKVPIVYRNEYNIGFLGLEKLHPFDSKKWGNVFNYLKEAIRGLTEEKIHSPPEVTPAQLLKVHTQEYIDSLTKSVNVAKITEVFFLAAIPNFVVQRRVLKPFRFQVGGTLLAGELCMEHKWSINIGGGFHHCSKDRGGGFCAYADITLCIRNILEKYSSRVKKVLLIDLDAHQGNGHERDFLGDESVYIFDMYNKYIYPGDMEARAAIKKSVELFTGTTDEEYLLALRSKLQEAFEEAKPDFVFFNAGTDILEGDTLGRLSITREGIIERDEIVFRKAKEAGVPIVMVTSGGYVARTAKIIADSIVNLKDKGLIHMDLD